MVVYTVSILFLALGVFLVAVSQIMIIKRQKESDKQLQKLQRQLQQLE
jgi:preprotein translocase subunit YajC